MKSLRDEVAENGGYHIFSLERNQTPNYYPGAFNDYPGVSLKNLNPNDMITVKAFYIYESDPRKILIDIYIELLVNEIGDYTVKAKIMTPLPTKFPLSRGEILEIQEDEILYKVTLYGAQRRSLDVTRVH